MKKLITVLFMLSTIAVFADRYDKEESIIKGRLYADFPIKEKGIILDEIDVDIEDDGAIEIEIEFAHGSKVASKNYKTYANKIAKSVNQIIKNINNKNLVLKKIEIETSGIRKNKQIFRY